MRINTNIAALNTQGRLITNNSNIQASLEKLSSGLRINKAADDAAGLAISEKMRAQIRGLSRAADNAQDGISLIQTAEGALAETTSILQRMRELAVQATNDIMSEADRNAIQVEMTQLRDEIERSNISVAFNGKRLLTGEMADGYWYRRCSFDDLIDETYSSSKLEDFALEGEYKITVYKKEGNSNYFAQIRDSNGNAVINPETGTEISDARFCREAHLDENGLAEEMSVYFRFASIGLNSFIKKGTPISEFTEKTHTIINLKGKTANLHVGANANDEGIAVEIKDMTALTGLDLTNDNIDVTDADKAKNTLEAIEQAIENVNTQRGNLGASQNRLEYAINSLASTEENLTTAESRIRDVDMASEMVSYTKNNILNRAATAMLAQSNQLPQSVLVLLQQTKK